jgi:hypothetical protein
VELAEILVQRLQLYYKTGSPLDNVLEPSAGAGAFCGPLSAIAESVSAVDPNFEAPKDLPENVEWAQMSLEDLHDELGGQEIFDQICGNPPFSLAEAHVKLCYHLLKPGACLGFLLRLAFLESLKRVQFFAAYPPIHIFVLPRRPTFMWAWHCNECGHKWFCLPKVKEPECPVCASEAIHKNTSDSAAYAFFIWKKGHTGSTTISHLSSAPGEEP